ncbi:hypothetical protein DXG03_005721 [Asterophora parasitica]|uniref:Amino acid permease/ SLC12A domain-containing protein n=1 Tax=Asterophora parasitica TaxID=117018 RepID=A0A9P7KCH4_9AGAR|nr:hypothetical protein DXG03_005721 [Asterophora parasitica]
MTKAFSTVFFRMATFYIIGAISVGIVVPYNDKDLLDALSAGRPGAGSSPYVIAMDHLNIPVLPHIVNFLILSSIFSAGNGYVYCASRTLLGLALEGKAPRFLTKLINIVTASQVLNFGFIAFTYIFFYRALKAQGISRDSLPHKGWWQPFCGLVSTYQEFEDLQLTKMGENRYYGVIGTVLMVLISGYTVFLPGRWSAVDFIFSYIMVGFLPLLFVFWKFFRKTKWRDPKSVDFFLAERKEIDNYEDAQG